MDARNTLADAGDATFTPRLHSCVGSLRARSAYRNGRHREGLRRADKNAKSVPYGVKPRKVSLGAREKQHDKKFKIRATARQVLRVAQSNILRKSSSASSLRGLFFFWFHLSDLCVSLNRIASGRILSLKLKARCL